MAADTYINPAPQFQGYLFEIPFLECDEVAGDWWTGGSVVEEENGRDADRKRRREADRDAFILVVQGTTCDNRAFEHGLRSDVSQRNSPTESTRCDVPFRQEHATNTI